MPYTHYTPATSTPATSEAPIKNIKTLEGAVAAGLKRAREIPSFNKYSDDEIGESSVKIITSALRLGALELYYIDGQIAVRSIVPIFSEGLRAAREAQEARRKG